MCELSQQHPPVWLGKAELSRISVVSIERHRFLSLSLVLPKARPGKVWQDAVPGLAVMAWGSERSRDQEQCSSCGHCVTPGGAKHSPSRAHPWWRCSGQGGLNPLPRGGRRELPFTGMHCYQQWVLWCPRGEALALAVGGMPWVRCPLVRHPVSLFVPKLMCSVFACDWTPLSYHQQQWKKAWNCLTASWQVNGIAGTLKRFLRFEVPDETGIVSAILPDLFLFSVST